MTSLVFRLATRIPYFSKRIERRKMAQALHNLDYGTLKDIGMFRSEIDAYVYGRNDEPSRTYKRPLSRAL